MLRKACEHDRYDEHPWDDWGEVKPFTCPGGSDATFDDLIAALREQGAEGLVQVRYVGPEQTPFHIDEALVWPLV